MSYCINPRCPQPDDPANSNNRLCRHCGSELFLQGRYQVMRLLADSSGFGKVYEAYNGSIPKILKVLKPKHNNNPRVIELFQQEAAVLGQLDHPGIPKIEPDGYFQYFPRDATEPVHCIIMEKIDSLNLKQWMQQQGNHPISEKQALNWLNQLAEILHLVHQKNYFHRDIKPANIMLRSSGQLVLIDFGTARELTYTYLADVGGAGSVTKISSAGYTPPEQEKGHAVPQSDFYALGRTFVYLMTGMEATDALIYDPLSDRSNWRQHAPQISEPLADFIDKLMAPTAMERPKNTQEILDDLAKLANNRANASSSGSIEVNTNGATSLQSPVTQPQIASQLSSHSPSHQLSQKKWLIGGAIALVLGLGYGAWLMSDDGTSPQAIVFKKIALEKSLDAHSGFVNDLKISLDGERLVSAGADKTIKLWNLSTGEVIRTIVDAPVHINYFVISPDWQKIVTGNTDNSIAIWDFETGKELLTLTGHSSFVNHLAISPDGKRLVSASADNTIKLWDLATGEKLKTLKGHSSFVNYVLVSADGKKLVSASADDTIKIWDFNTGELLNTLEEHSASVNALEITPDGRKLVSASADNTIKLWDLTTGKEIRTLTEHSSPVKPLAISPDGKVLASGSADGAIKLWDLATGKEIRTLTGHSSSINALDISPDGETLVSGSADKTIKVWQLPR